MNNNKRIFPKVNYIGNKGKLAKWVVESFPEDVHSVMDVFAGGGSISYALKTKDIKVIANDSLYSSFVVNKALIENKEVKLNKELITKIDRIPIDMKTRNSVNWLEDNLFYEYEVDELTKLIQLSYELKGYKKYLFLALLRRAMIRKLPYSRMNINWNNIVKLRDEEYSYKKYGRKRAYHNKTFQFHMLKEIDSYNNCIFDNGQKNMALQLDAFDAINRFGHVDAIYMDPPYPGTMNNYQGFYGPFDQIFNKAIEFTDLTSGHDFLDKLEKLVEIASTRAKYLILSINSHIKPSYKDVMNLLTFYGNVSIKNHKHNYQVSGKATKNENMELLLVVQFYK